jgi:RNA polymerase-interacting CarD/CdnL/TRCF family regulator
MTLPELTPGTTLFVPRHGVFTIIDVRDQVLEGATHEICDLRHHFTATKSSRAVDGMRRTHVRAPTKQATAYTLVEQLHAPPRHRLRGHWNRQREELERRLNLGTLEKNIETVRLLHHIDQDSWKTARVSFYQHALTMVVEELAFIFNESREHTERLIVKTLNATVLASLTQ